MVLAHAGIALWHHFHHWIIKNMDLETASHFGTPNHEQIHNCLQSGSREIARMHSKINKKRLLDLKVPVGCPCGPLDHQNGHSGHQIAPSRSPKQKFGV